MIKRLTKQKQALLKILSHEPQSVQQIEISLTKAKQSMDQSTIYRNLNAMVESGLLTATTFDQKTKLYELAHHEHHHHILCEKCGKIGDVCLDEQILIDQVSKQCDFQITGHHLEFFGRCSACY